MVSLDFYVIRVVQIQRVCDVCVTLPSRDFDSRDLLEMQKWAIVFYGICWEIDHVFSQPDNFQMVILFVDQA